MSAYLCSKRHVVALACILVDRGIRAGIADTARLLRAANNTSLHARYGEQPEMLGRINDIVNVRAFTDAEINTLARCFLYQCDHGGVRETHQVCRDLDKLVEQTGGPEAKLVNAMWGY